VLLVVRVVTSVIVSVWGLVMVLLGLGQGQLLWIPLGLAVLAVGIPLLASNPIAAPRLYPTRTESPGIGS
jgi:hypothetical protein